MTKKKNVKLEIVEAGINLTTLNEGRLMDAEKAEIDKTEMGSESLGDIEATPRPEGGEAVLGRGDLGAGGDMDAGDIAAMNAERVSEIEHVDVPKITIEPGGFALHPTPIGTQNPAHRFFWRGHDINRREHIGSGDSASQCNIDAGLQGSCTCHLSSNPAFIEPVIAPVAEALSPTPHDLNSFYNAGYAKGHEEAFRLFEDLKALILVWVTDQNLSGGMPDVETLPFVQYVRNNP